MWPNNIKNCQYGIFTPKLALWSLDSVTVSQTDMTVYLIACFINSWQWYDLVVIYQRNKLIFKLGMAHGLSYDQKLRLAFFVTPGLLILLQKTEFDGLLISKNLHGLRRVLEHLICRSVSLRNTPIRSWYSLYSCQVDLMCSCCADVWWWWCLMMMCYDACSSASLSVENGLVAHSQDDNLCDWALRRYNVQLWASRH